MQESKIDQQIAVKDEDLANAVSQQARVFAPPDILAVAVKPHDRFNPRTLPEAQKQAVALDSELNQLVLLQRMYQDLRKAQPQGQVLGACYMKLVHALYESKGQANIERSVQIAEISITLQKNFIVTVIWQSVVSFAQGKQESDSSRLQAVLGKIGGIFKSFVISLTQVVELQQISGLDLDFGNPEAQIGVVLEVLFSQLTQPLAQLGIDDPAAALISAIDDDSLSTKIIEYRFAYNKACAQFQNNRECSGQSGGILHVNEEKESDSVGFSQAVISYEPQGAGGGSAQGAPGTKPVIGAVMLLVKITSQFSDEPLSLTAIQSGCNKLDDEQNRAQIKKLCKEVGGNAGKFLKTLDKYIASYQAFFTLAADLFSKVNQAVPDVSLDTLNNVLVQLSQGIAHAPGAFVYDCLMNLVQLRANPKLTVVARSVYNERINVYLTLHNKLTGVNLTPADLRQEAKPCPSVADMMAAVDDILKRAEHQAEQRPQAAIADDKGLRIEGGANDDFDGERDDKHAENALVPANSQSLQVVLSENQLQLPLLPCASDECA